MALKVLLFVSFVAVNLIGESESRMLSKSPEENFLRARRAAQEPNEGGWFRRQLNKLNEAARGIGQKVQGQTRKITGAIDKACDKIKQFAPVLAVICHFGHFRICPSSNELADYLPPDAEDALRQRYLTRNEMEKLKQM